MKKFKFEFQKSRSILTNEKYIILKFYQESCRRGLNISSWKQWVAICLDTEWEVAMGSRVATIIIHLDQKALRISKPSKQVKYFLTQSLFFTYIKAGSCPCKFISISYQYKIWCTIKMLYGYGWIFALICRRLMGIGIMKNAMNVW